MNLMVCNIGPVSKGFFICLKLQYSLLALQHIVNVFQLYNDSDA